MSKDLVQRLLDLAEQAVDEALRFEYGDYTQREIYKTLKELRPLAKQALSAEPQEPTDEANEMLE
jgi:hypothetical protein